MKSDPAQPTEDQRMPRERWMQYSQINNVRAVPQISERDRDHVGPVPFVMLRGTWLRRFGFEVGVHIRIEVVHSQITVRPLWTTASSKARALRQTSPSRGARR